MSTIINATTTNGVVIQPDNSGSLVLQTNSGTTALTIDTSQRAAFVAGTAALPAITTSGDTNTGMFFPAADTIAFAEGGTEAMRLDSSGNVGIGTSSPSAKLDVASTNGNLIYLRSTSAYSTTPFTDLAFQYQYESGGTYTGGTAIRFSKENATNNEYGSFMSFYTRANGGSTTERMRINSSGNVLIGLSSSNFGTAPKIETQVADGRAIGISNSGTGTATAGIFLNNSNASVGSITYTTTATAYNTSSDYRLKENIAPMTGALATVQALKPVTYKWKYNGSNGQGFIAHELAEVVPDCVTGEKDAIDTEGNPEYQGVDTSFLVATLTAAIQEQQTIINDLKARIETLEAK